MQEFLYDNTRDTSLVRNVLLVDRVVSGYQMFCDACNADTFPIVYSSACKKEELIGLLRKKFSQIDRLCLAFEFQPLYMFLDNELLFRANESVAPFSPNVSFMLSLLKEFGIGRVDFLACDSLTNASWKHYYELLQRESGGVLVGASNDKTGNLSFGGDWVLESTNEDIEQVYFTRQIHSYTHLLDYTSFHNALVLEDGTVVASGYGYNGQLGSGENNGLRRFNPMIMPPGKTAVMAASGSVFTIVLMRDGTLWVTGESTFSGSNGIVYQLTEIPVPAGKVPIHVSCGRRSALVMMSDKTIWGMGDNEWGLLGINSFAGPSTLTEMILPPNKTPLTFSCGVYSCVVLMTDGTAWGCGYNGLNMNKLGIGTNLLYTITLVQIPMPSGYIPIEVACDTFFTVFIMSDGSVWGVGNNSGGELGLGPNNDVVKEVSRIALPDAKTAITAVTTGGATVVMMSDGSIYGTGQLSDVYERTNSMFLVNKMIFPSGKSVAQLCCNPPGTVALMTDGTVYGAGSNYDGAFGENFQGGLFFTPLTVSKPCIYVSSGSGKLPTIGSFVIAKKTYGDEAFEISLPSSESNGEFVYASSDSSVATVSGNTVTIHNAGTTTINAIQLPTSIYKSNVSSATFTVEPAITTLTEFSIPEILSFGDDTSFTLVDPVSNRGGSIVYSTSNNLVATINGKEVEIVGGGVVTITARQPATRNYYAGRISANCTVKPSKNILSSFSIPNKKYGTHPFTIQAPETKSVGAFTYSSANTDVATISGNVVTILGAGSSIITATQAPTDSYLAGVIHQTLTVLPNAPTIDSFLISAKSYGDKPFDIVDPVSNSLGVFTYTSSNEAVALISSGNKVIMVGAGKTTITAHQSANAVYGAAQVSTIFTVLPAQPVMQELLLPNKFFGDEPFSLVDPGSDSSGFFVYSSSDLTVATISSDNVVTVVGPGSTTITATQVATTNHASASVSAVLMVNPAPLQITDFVVMPKAYGDEPFDLINPASNSDGTFIFSSSDASVAMVAGKTVTVVGAGTATITATQEATSAYGSGNIYATLVVDQVSPVLGDFTIAPKSFGDAPFLIVPPTTNSEGAFNYISSNALIATIENNMLTIRGSGTVTITAMQDATVNYTSANVSTSLVIAPTVPTLSSFSIPSKIFGDMPFVLTDPESNNSEGGFIYTSFTPSVASVDGNVVTILGAGTAIISASQEATGNYGVGSINGSFNVQQKAPTLSDLVVEPKTYGDDSFTLVPPVSDSDGQFTYSSSDETVATVNGDTVSIVGAGQVMITATQLPSVNYTSGHVIGNLVIAQRAPTISMNLPSSEIVFGENTFLVKDVVSNSAGLCTFSSSDDSVATIEDNVVTILSAGTVTITVNQQATANYLEGTASVLLTVNPANPLLNNFAIPSYVHGATDVALVDPTSNSNGTFVYESSDPTVVSVSGNALTIGKAGTATITVVQSPSANYSSNAVSATMTVSAVKPSLSSFYVPPKARNSGSFALVAPTSNSTGAFTYASSNHAVATINNDIVTIVGEGVSIITAYQQAVNKLFLAGEISTSLSVSASVVNAPVLSNFAVPAKVFDDSSFPLSDPTSNSAGEFTFQVSPTSTVISIVDNIVTILGTGSETITAIQAATAEFAEASISATITVNAVSPTLTNFVIPVQSLANTSYTLVDPTSDSNGAFVYSSSDTSVATVSQNVVTLIKEGVCVITASQEPTANYLGAKIATSLLVTRATPILEEFGVLSKSIAEQSFELVAPSSNSDGSFRYVSSNSSVATITDNKVTMVGLGVATITAIQSATAIFNEQSIATTLTVTSAVPPTLSELSLPSKTVGDVAFEIADPISNSNGAFTYTSSDLQVAVVYGRKIYVIGPGTATITATQASTSTYGSASVASLLLVKPKTSRKPTISDLVLPTNKSYGDSSFLIVNPESNSDGSFSYASSDESIATVSGNEVTILKPGTVSITATQSSTDLFDEANVSALLVVAPAVPLLSEFRIAPTVFQENIALPPLSEPRSSATGEKIFVYTSSNHSVAVVEGNVVTVKGAGTCMITAVQSASDFYTSATISALLVVTPAVPTIGALDLLREAIQNDSVEISPPTSTSNGSVRFRSSNTKVAVIAGNRAIFVGAGSVTISAIQSETTNYKGILVGSEVTVSPLVLQEPVLTEFNVPPKVYGASSFSLNSPQSNSNGTFTYTCNNDAVATITEEGLVTVVGAGNATIVARQASVDTFSQGFITASLVVSRATPVVSTFSIAKQVFGGSAFSFTLNGPTSNSDGSFVFASSNSNVATIVGNVVTIVGLGETTIKATLQETSNFESSEVTTSLIVNGTPTLSNFAIARKKYGDASFAIPMPLSNSDGDLVYTSSNRAVAVVSNNNTITIVGAGTSDILATQSETNVYSAGSIATNVVVTSSNSTLSNFNLPVKKYRDASFDLVNPSSDSDGSFTYSSSDQSVATIEGNRVTILNAGESIITAFQAETINFKENSISSTLTIEPFVTVLSEFAVPAKVFGDDPFSLVAPKSNRPGAFVYRSNDLTVATVLENVVTLVGPGNATITVSQEATGNDTGASISAVLTVDRPPFTELSNFVIPSKTYGSSSFTLTAPQSTSNGAFTYTSSNNAVATVSGNVVTIVKAGSTIITALQEGTIRFPSASITATFTVNQAMPTLTSFTNITKTFGDAVFSLVAPNSNSPGAFTFTTDNPSVATISGNQVTILRTGLANITASQASSVNYLAKSVSAVLTVQTAVPTLTFSIPYQIFGRVSSFVLVPPVSNSNGTFSYTTSTPSVATISGGIVTINGVGSTTIVASQQATSNYTSATISAVLLVKPIIKPTLSNFVILPKAFGEIFEVPPPTSDSNGRFSYKVSNPFVAKVAGKIVTIIGNGTTSITATQEEYENYLTNSITTTLMVDSATPSLSDFEISMKTFKNTPTTFVIKAPRSNNAKGLFSYTSSNQSVATISGSVVTLVGRGSTVITATQAPTASFDTGSISTTMVVNALPTISSFSVPAKIFGDASFQLTPPKTNSDGTFTYTSSNTKIATIVGNMVTLVGTGTTAITATVSETANYASATISANLVVGASKLKISNFAIAQRSFGDTPFAITPPQSTSPGAFKYTSSNLSVMKITGNTAIIMGVGQATITATQAATANFGSSSITTIAKVVIGTPVINRDAVWVLPSKTFGEPSFAIPALTSTSKAAFKYTSSNPSVATISGNKITIKGVGATTITATQAPTLTYASKSISTTFTVSKAVPTVSLNIPAQAFNSYFTLAPISNSPGTFTYSIDNPSIATITDSVLYTRGVGSATITVTQKESANYTEKTITVPLIVNKAIPTINLALPTGLTYESIPFDLAPLTQSTSPGQLSFAIENPNSAVATLANGKVTIVGVGSATITVSQNETDFFAAKTTTVTMTVGQATPTVTFQNFSVVYAVGGTFELNPSSTSTGKISFKLTSNLGLATINEKTFTINNVGKAKVQLIQDATTHYKEARVIATMTVTQGTPTVSLTIPTRTYQLGDSFTLAPTPQSEENFTFAPISDSLGKFTYLIDKGSVARIVGNTVTVVGAGSATLTISQASTTLFTATTITVPINIDLATPVFDPLVLEERTVGDEPFQLVVNSNSTGELSYVSDNESVATVSNLGIVTIVGEGSANITVNQKDTANFIAGSVSGILKVNNVVPPPEENV